MYAQKFSLAVALTEKWQISLSRSVFGLMAACVFVWILYTYFSSVPVNVLEQCLCICFGAYVCANARANMQVCGGCLSVCEMPWVESLQWEQQGRETTGEQQTQFLAQKRFKYFLSLSVGGKIPVAEKTTTNDQLHLLFFCHLSHFPSRV